MTTALLSVYDKAGVTELATGLHELGWRLISSGGTAKAIAGAGLPVTDVAELTGFPAILGHRVVTLHPAVHAGLLADLDQPEHRAELAELGIEPIALLVANLYPFATQPGIELIDVGGPAMIRAAAKNHAHVGVVVDPAQYGPVLDELREAGALVGATRRRLAQQAFARTAAYDAAIAGWMASGVRRREHACRRLPATMTVELERVQDLRYGENPHQQAARYRIAGARSWWDDAVQHGGKELSYLNLYDTEAAWRLVHRFEGPAVVIVKHANPCGVAVAARHHRRVRRGQRVRPGLGLRWHRGHQPSCARGAGRGAGPGVHGGRRGAVVHRRRLVRARGQEEPPRPVGAAPVRQPARPAQHRRWPARPGRRSGLARPGRVDGADRGPARRGHVAGAGLRVAGLRGGELERHRAHRRRPGPRHRRRPAEPGRLRPHRRRQGRGPRRRGCCASDAFFPFRDGLDAVAEAGVRAVIQPGGSVRDAEVIAAADEHGIAMVLTGERHFRH